MSNNVTDLVHSFAESQGRFDSYQALARLGTEALPALRKRLRSGDWRVRRWRVTSRTHEQFPSSSAYSVTNPIGNYVCMRITVLIASSGRHGLGRRTHGGRVKLWQYE